MTKPGETASYSASDHLREIIKYMGGDYLDYIIISNTKCSDRALRQYAKKYQHPVSFEKIDKIHSMTKAKVKPSPIPKELTTDLVKEFLEA